MRQSAARLRLRRPRIPPPIATHGPSLTCKVAYSSTPALRAPRKSSTPKVAQEEPPAEPENERLRQILLQTFDGMPLDARIKVHNLTGSELQQTSGPPPPEEPTAEDAKEKRMRPRRRTTPAEAEETIPMYPVDVRLLQSLSYNRMMDQWPVSSRSPSRDALDDAYSKLLVALNHRTQVLALPRPDAEQSIPEPTIALYCPMEGGNYVLDETVQELSRMLSANVVTLDVAQLAAGESGAYGKAAVPFKFPSQPLHTSRKQHIPPTPPSPGFDEESAPSQQTMVPSGVHMAFPSIQIHAGDMKPTRMSPLSGRRVDEARKRQFFDQIIHGYPTPADLNTPFETPIPRILYVRDVDLIAEDVEEWHSQMMASVHAYRRGNSTSSTSTVVNPIVIVYGVSPPLQEYFPAPGSSHASGTVPNDELDGAHTREKELRSWLKQWDQQGDAAIREELPQVFTFGESGPSPNAPSILSQLISSPSFRRGRVIPLGATGGPMAQSRFGPREVDPDPDDEGSLFTSVVGIIPETRSLELEAEERFRRRKGLNKLAFRTFLNRIGGTVGDPVQDYVSGPKEHLAALSEATSESDESHESQDPLQSMFWAWERSLVDRDVLQEVATKALRGSLAKNIDDSMWKPPEDRPPKTVDLIEVSWQDVALAWKSYYDALSHRKQWINTQRHSSTTESGSTSAAADPEFDEVIESVKADPNLDTHEKRLLGCIVDTATMPTTFNEVHLPFKTIDAIRTMVSLPLLYPDAFNEGVLKHHSMTGALLMGPPGVGKTLMARAVAKESGARMLMVKPSDVMDMYVGEGEKLVKAVFSLARRLSPCVIFLDEVDALLASRISSRESGSAIAHRSVITEFMQEMDGLKTNRSQGNIVVIGATNRPFDLDDAILRRFPRRLLIDLPGEQERKKILQIHLRGENLAPEIDVDALAKRTDMYSGSDLKNLVVAAALDAVKENALLPWNQSEGTSTAESRSDDPAAFGARTLHQTHFEKALTEVTPSSSESLGTLHDLRKWNEEFGEGRTKSGGRRTKWGLKFGFGGKDGKDADGRVMQESP